MKGAKKTMEVNEEKRQKFMENAGKRVNKVMHDIQILEPMSRSSVYDFTKQDVEEMFYAMQDALDAAKEEFNKKFEEKAKSEKRVFSFGSSNTIAVNNTVIQTLEGSVVENNIDGIATSEENAEV